MTYTMACDQQTDLAFVADSTLGKLAKNLRLAGFDTLLDKGVPSTRRLVCLAAGQRIVLTRSTKVKKELGAGHVVFIHANQPSVQMSQLIATVHLRREDLRPMSLCALCNRRLDCVNPDEVRGRVPDFVRQQHSRFKACPACKRIYWPGTHTDRWMRRMEMWFNSG
ncbi:MAG: hypothetical protein C4519_13590 [Desulfobacteraceae bacterium]|nr:MAG: hypothetical protein C4519_13590 [Desulfobacteraceae bacterium]